MGCIQREIAASTPSSQCNSGLNHIPFIPKCTPSHMNMNYGIPHPIYPKTQNAPPQPHEHELWHEGTPKCTSYISNMDVGSNQKESCCGLNFDITTSHQLGSTPKTPKFTTDLQRRITVTPYASYKQHTKVPKHFVYIQYGCGIQSEDCCSLSFDIMTSHWLTGLQSTH